MPTPMRGGKNYYGVNERLTAAHGDAIRPTGITSIITKPVVLGNMIAVVATVTFTDGRVFTGMSEAKMDATTGADKDAPLECADTSAVGRALAFAGYFGSDDGLAGPEEVRTAQQREANRAQAQRPPQATRAPQPPRQAAPAREALAHAEATTGVAPAGGQPITRAQKEARYMEIARLAIAAGIAPVHPVEYFAGQPDEDLRAEAMALQGAIKAKKAEANGEAEEADARDTPPSSVADPPATPKQIQTIERMARAAGTPIETQGLTRAQASSVLSQLIEAMGLSR